MSSLNAAVQQQLQEVSRVAATSSMPGDTAARLVAALAQTLRRFSALADTVLEAGGTMEDVEMAGEAILKDQERKQAKAAETVGELEKEILHKLDNAKALHEALMNKGKIVHARALDLSHAKSDEERRVKEISAAILQQLRGEIDYLMEEGLSAARAIGRLGELEKELDQVTSRAEQMEKVFSHGMAVYDELHKLGSRFSDYSEENRQTFWPSLLSWLREEKFEDKFSDLKSMVAGWEGHLKQEQESRKEYEASLSKIVEYNEDEGEDDQHNEENSSAGGNVQEAKKKTRRLSSSHSVTSDGSAKSAASKDKERFQNAIRQERKKKRAREEKIQQLQEAKKKKESDAKESRKLATQRARRASSEAPINPSTARAGRRSRNSLGGRL